MGALTQGLHPLLSQPHERDALLAGSLNTTLHLANEQERDDWPADGPKVPEPCSHHRGRGHSKHPSGSNVSFSRDPEGSEEEPAKVRGAESSPRSQAQGAPPPPLQGPKGGSQPGGWRLEHSFSVPRLGLAGHRLWPRQLCLPPGWRCWSWGWGGSLLPVTACQGLPQKDFP